MAKHKFVTLRRRGATQTASSVWMVAGLLRPLVLRAVTALNSPLLAPRFVWYRITPAALHGRDGEPPSL
ncbi:MAG: hypothetical protein P4L42_17385 [Desulfocapsaceae bacterium]|nr:hypothetical protein [Desulfocapsaceae bacterium]